MNVHDMLNDNQNCKYLYNKSIIYLSHVLPYLNRSLTSGAAVRLVKQLTRHQARYTTTFTSFRTAVVMTAIAGPVDWRTVDQIAVQRAYQDV